MSALARRRRPNLTPHRRLLRYDELRELRETEAEADAAKMRKALQSTRDKSERLISSLREELAQQKQSTVDLTSAVALAEKLEAENAALRQQLAAAGGPAVGQSSSADASVLKFMEMMTGLAVKIQGSKAQCTLNATSEEGVARKAAFEVDLAPADGEEGEIEYVPTDLSEVADRVPEYLTDSITCEHPPNSHPPQVATVRDGLASPEPPPRAPPRAQSTRRRHRPSCSAFSPAWRATRRARGGPGRSCVLTTSPDGECGAEGARAITVGILCSSFLCVDLCIPDARATRRTGRPAQCAAHSFQWEPRSGSNFCVFSGGFEESVHSEQNYRSESGRLLIASFRSGPPDGLRMARP